jgi:excisionase family DNA binding protein
MRPKFGPCDGSWNAGKRLSTYPPSAPTNRKGARMIAAETTTALLIDASQVCARLSIGKSKLHQMLRAGHFPVAPVRLGRAVRYRADELAQWVAAGCPSSDRYRAMQAMSGRRIGGAI